MIRWMKRKGVRALESMVTGFLKHKDPYGQMEKKLQTKIKKLSNTGIGKELGISKGIGQSKIPLTNYDFFMKYYNNPTKDDFMYPLTEYLKVTTSGTMSKPKKYLLPKQAIEDNAKKTGLATLFAATHDGESSSFEMGDMFYMNIPGGSQIANYLYEIGGKQMINILKRCPDPDLPFHTKVDYFVKHYKEIDLAYMTVPTLFDDVVPRIPEPLQLKGFMTNDTSARVYKDEIKKLTGSYPKVAFGSTETLSATVPSVEHPGGFIWDWRVIYPEFLPEEEKVEFKGVYDESVDTVHLQNVERGELYQLIVSPYLMDHHRYVMPDIMECIAIGDDALETDQPVFHYYSRADRIMVLHNFTRITEEELILMLKESGIPWVDFTAKKVNEDHKDFMKIFIELSKPMSEEEIVKRLNKALTDFDRDWHDLVNFLKFVPLKVEVLPRGIFNRYLEEKEGMYRVERINMKQEWLDRLLSYR